MSSTVVPLRPPVPMVGVQGTLALALVPRAAAVAPAAAEDVSEQLGNLVFAGFVAATGYEHLVDVPRYLSAAEQRLTALVAGNVKIINWLTLPTAAAIRCCSSICSGSSVIPRCTS